VAGMHAAVLPAPPLRLRVLADHTGPAGGAVASLTRYQVTHGEACFLVVLDPWRRNTHDSPIYRPPEAVEVGSQVDGEQFVHGLPLSGEREPPKWSPMLPR
jgi:hypothetical protein